MIRPLPFENMLTIEPPYYSVRGITIFRDHAIADQFYYLPGAVALARTGSDQRLAFTLYKYRRDLTGNPALDPSKARGAGLALIETRDADWQRPRLCRRTYPARRRVPMRGWTPSSFDRESYTRWRLIRVATI